MVGMEQYEKRLLIVTHQMVSIGHMRNRNRKLRHHIPFIFCWWVTCSAQECLQSTCQKTTATRERDPEREYTGVQCLSRQVLKTNLPTVDVHMCEFRGISFGSLWADIAKIVITHYANFFIDVPYSSRLLTHIRTATASNDEDGPFGEDNLSDYITWLVLQ